jgi:splicing factor 3A subunit 1
MAVATTNGDAAAEAAAALENLKPPPGVIIPPPGEIREAIEKTAGYVMRGGVGLEQRIRDNHGKNPKFNFLMTSSDPYNAYYEWRKEEIKSGRGTALAAGRVGEAAAAPAPEKPAGPLKPPDFQFSARMPRMSQKDLEIVRLTALFVAKNGRPFMTQLAQREASNPQFQFLIPNHTFHNFFQSMVDQYSILLRESGVNGEGSKAQKERVDQLRQNAADKYKVLARAKQRAAYAKWQEAEKAKQEEEEEMKKVEFARIDWNDFVVVETIVFTEADDQASLPPPTTLNDLQYASLEERNKASVSSTLRIEEAFPFEDTSYNAYPLQTYGAQAPAAPSAPAANTPPQQQYGASVLLASRTRAAEEEAEAQRIQEREQERLRQQAQAEARGGAAPMKIKENYVPRAAQRAASKFGTQTAMCPNCKQQIPLNEMDEHMRSKFFVVSTVSGQRANALQLNCSILGGRSRRPRPMRGLPPPTCLRQTWPTTSSGWPASEAMCLTRRRASPSQRRRRCVGRRLRSTRLTATRTARARRISTNCRPSTSTSRSGRSTRSLLLKRSEVSIEATRWFLGPLCGGYIQRWARHLEGSSSTTGAATRTALGIGVYKGSFRAEARMLSYGPSRDFRMSKRSLRKGLSSGDTASEIGMDVR